MTDGRRIAVLGAGSFGTAVAAALSRRNREVQLYCRTPEQCDAITRTRQNARYFPGHEIPATITPTSDLALALSADVLFLSFPAKAMGDYAAAIGARGTRDTIVVNLVKGLHSEHFSFAELFRHAAPQVRYAALKGPTFARPLFLGEWSGLTCGADDPATVDTVIALFDGAQIMFDRSSSPDAVDIVSALKNVYAIALGLIASSGPSENTTYLAVTLMLREMSSIIRDLGYDAQVLLSFAGVGDTLLTSLCDTSRNRTLGLMMGKGIPIDLVRSDFLAEGVRAVTSLRQHVADLDTPFLSVVEQVLAGQAEPASIFELFTGG